MEGQQSLHDPPNQFGNGYFPPATAPKTGDRCSQISPRSSIRCVTPCEPICDPPTAQDNTNPHLRTPKRRCEPFVAECKGGDPEATPLEDGEMGRRRKSRIKPWRLVSPRQPLLPAVRTVCGGRGWGHNQKEIDKLRSLKGKTSLYQGFEAMSLGQKEAFL